MVTDERLAETLDAKALSAARKRVERMMHDKGIYGRGRLTIHGIGGMPQLTAKEVATEVVVAYLQSLRAQGGVREPSAYAKAYIRDWCPDSVKDYISSLEASPAPVSEPTHRHKKRGTEYVLLGIGKIQSEDWCYIRGSHEVVPVDDTEVAIYQSATNGSLWVRELREFEDGRFEALAAKGGQ